MNYLIDTNICIYIMNQQPADVIEKFMQHEMGDIAVSSITISELQYGIEKSGNPKKNQSRLDEFLTPFDVLEFGQREARVYGAIRFQLEKNGQPIGPLDLLIAAHAMSEMLVLVTNNEKEFKRIEGLKVENWANRRIP